MFRERKQSELNRNWLELGLVQARNKEYLLNEENNPSTNS